MPQSQASKRRSESNPQGNGNISAKRSRVSRACDQCRTAREKCDGQPICSTCSTAKRACTYTTNPKKRGIQPGYIRTLELALTWLFNNSEAEALLNNKLAQEGASSVLLERDSKESNRLHKSWRRSKFCKDVDRLLSGEDIGQDESRSPNTDSEDSDTEENRNVRVAVSLGPSSGVQQDAITLPNLDPLPSHRKEADLMQLPVDRWKLFDIYFGYTHCWFPICEKHNVLKLSYAYPEQGLTLSQTQSASGDHAELWSILALASLQDSSRNRASHPSEHDPRPKSSAQIYNVARSLIPLELETFELGHIKALLILALVHLSQSCPEAAWLLVGHASRIVAGFEQQHLSQDMRFSHVFAGCFLLDNLVSMQLQRRPYLQASEMERIGKIFEGSEEWQPWTGCLGPTQTSSQRAPVLNLSTFNCLVEVSGIISVAESPEGPRSILQEVIGRVELWKASLPPEFEHIRTGHIPIPHAPPALLLQLVYNCCCLVIFSSQSCAQRIVELLARFREEFGLIALSPIANCVLEATQRNRAFLALDGASQTKFQDLCYEFNQSWNCKITENLAAEHRNSKISGRPIFTPTDTVSQHSIRPTSAQIPTPESIHIPFNPAFGTNRTARTNSTLLDDLLPDMNPAAVAQQPQPIGYNNGPSLQEFNTHQYGGGFNPPIPDHNLSTVSRDVETFFDELASLDGAERVETQPQFMQNLGFAPDANMADLFTTDFGQFNQLLSPFQQGHNDPTTLEQNKLFQPG